jgi:hypothetical protein
MSNQMQTSLVIIARNSNPIREPKHTSEWTLNTQTGHALVLTVSRDANRRPRTGIPRRAAHPTDTAT